MQFWAEIMQVWKSSEQCRTVGILLFDAFSNYCLANAVEPLRAANTIARKQLYRWQFLSLTGQGVTSSSGLPVQPDMALADHAGDYLFVMPSYDHLSHATPACARALRSAQARYKQLVGMDMGSWLLAHAGLLDGQTATLHWDELTNFAEAFPEVTVTEARTVTDGPILSCGGVSTTYELVLDLIGRHHGPMLALEVNALFMQGETALPPAPKHKRIEAAAALMRRNIEAPLTIPDIARQIGLPPKALSEGCQRAYGIGPRKLYQAIRLREARRMVAHTGLGIEEIASRCGYQNAAAMTRAFRQEFGVTPRDARAAQAVGSN